VLQFEVEAFQFTEVDNQQFRYYLKGFDEGFGEWTHTNTKEYTNLREGEYEFVVQAKNYLGKTIASQPLYLRVKPPFHRSLLARILYVALALLTLLLLFRLQRHRYRLKAAAAEDAKQQELLKKQQELVEIERQKELEVRQIEEDKIKSELQHLNNLLAASTMNLVVKNEFMETIKEELTEVKRKGKSMETKQALEKIVKEIDTTLKLQEDWEQFEYHFDQVHGDFLNRLREEFQDLTPNEQKLCTLLRLNLSTKEISNLMSISLRGVEIARYRLRKKLGLGTGQNLSKFMLEY
jgi:DNA-binding NarL/FixJ family response regulator